MAKRSIISMHNPTGIDDTVSLRSLYPAKMSVAAKSGKVYRWESGGIVVKVEMEDAQDLLEKRMGGCCGGKSYPLFEKVEE